MKPFCAAPVLALAAAWLLAGCADDPHPASGSTPGDPDHPFSASINNDQPAPETPPGSSGVAPTPMRDDHTPGPPGTLNGYGDPTTVESSR